MSAFKNSFEVLKEINDKKKTIVISDKPSKVKKPKTEKPTVEKAVAKVAPAAAAAAAPAAKKVEKKVAPVTNEPPKNSLQQAKEAVKRAQAEAAAKAAEEASKPHVEEPVAEPTVEPVAEAPVAEEAEAVEGTAEVAAEAAAPAAPVEAAKLTLAEFNRLKEAKRFVVEKQARRVDPTAHAGFEVLKRVESPVKVAPKKPEVKPAAPVKPAAAAKGVKAVIPAPVVALKTAPKEKKEKILSLGEFAAIEAPVARGGFRGGRGGYRGGRGGKSQELNIADVSKFPSL